MMLEIYIGEKLDIRLKSGYKCLYTVIHIIRPGSGINRNMKGEVNNAWHMYNKTNIHFGSALMYLRGMLMLCVHDAKPIV